MRVENASFVDHVSRLDPRGFLNKFSGGVGLGFKFAARYLVGVGVVVEVDPRVERRNKLFVANGLRGCEEPRARYDGGGSGSHRDLSLVQRDKISLRFAGIELPRSSDAI